MLLGCRFRVLACGVPRFSARIVIIMAIVLVFRILSIVIVINVVAMALLLYL